MTEAIEARDSRDGSGTGVHMPTLDGLPPQFQKRIVSEEVYLRVLDEAEGALEAASIPRLFIGGVASAVMGRPRGSLDIDFFVRPHDAAAALDALAAAGFDTLEAQPHWLLKGAKEGVVVDLIFQSTGGIYLDEEMMERSRVEEFSGRKLRLAAAEDIVMMKILAHTEQTARYWFDALAILARSEIDWAYLMRRARQGVNRTLSLLLYARSKDIVVPQRVIDELFALSTGTVEV